MNVELLETRRIRMIAVCWDGKIRGSYTRRHVDSGLYDYFSNVDEVVPPGDDSGNTFLFYDDDGEPRMPSSAALAARVEPGFRRRWEKAFAVAEAGSREMMR